MEVLTKPQTEKLFDFLISKIAVLEEKLSAIDETQEKWVKCGAASKITGLSRSTLERERVKPGTLINYHQPDKTYEVKSLIAYKNQKSKVVQFDPVKLRENLLAQVA